MFAAPWSRSGVIHGVDPMLYASRPPHVRREGRIDIIEGIQGPW